VTLVTGDTGSRLFVRLNVLHRQTGTTKGGSVLKFAEVFLLVNHETKPAPRCFWAKWNACGCVYSGEKTAGMPFSQARSTARCGLEVLTPAAQGYLSHPVCHTFSLVVAIVGTTWIPAPKTLCFDEETTEKLRWWTNYVCMCGACWMHPPPPMGAGARIPNERTDDDCLWKGMKEAGAALEEW